MKKLSVFFEDLKKIDLLPEAEQVLFKYFQPFCYKQKNNSPSNEQLKKSFDQYLEDVSFILANNNLADKILSSAIILSYVGTALIEINKIFLKTGLRQSVEFRYVQTVAEYESALSLSFDLLKNIPDLKRIGVMPAVAYKANLILSRSMLEMLSFINENQALEAKEILILDKIIRELNKLRTVLLEYQQDKYSDTQEIVRSLEIS